MKPSVTVIIRCFNEAKHIGRLLKGIHEQTLKDIEVVVVDSGSTDGTLEEAGKYPTKVIQIKPGDFSFGYALNVGCRAARGEYLVMASAHVYPVRTDWLERLLEPFGDHRVGLVYGKQQGNHLTKYAEHQIFAKWFPESADWDQRDFFCNNANAAIRRRLWANLQYDETLTGLEDLDMAKRLKAAGYKIAYEPSAAIVHVHEEGYRRILNRYRREAIALKRILPHEHFHLWDFMRLYPSNVVADYYHAWHDRVLVCNLIPIPLFRLMQYWGAYRGFRQHGPVSDSLKQRFYYPKKLSRRPALAEARDSGTASLIDYAEPKGRHG